MAFSGKGESESIIPLPVNRPWKSLLPPAVFECCCMRSLCVTLSSKTKCISVYLQALTYWGRLRHYFAILLIQYGAQQRALFIATLISSCPLDLTSYCSSCCEHSPLRFQTGAAGHCIAFTLSNTHIRSDSSVTGDLCEMQEKANKINSKCKGRNKIIEVGHSLSRNVSFLFSGLLALRK